MLIEIKYGTVESQLRYLPIPGGLKSQSRRIERDLAGNIELVSEWQDLGCTITVDDGPKRTWRGRFSDWLRAGTNNLPKIS